jgi:hypothetical protein
MDFGLSRFLEMFEERFGRYATTLLLGTLGLALFGYSVKITIEAAVYLYDLANSASWLKNISGESIIVRIVILSFQAIVGWALVSVFWRLFYQPRIRRIEQRIEESYKQVLQGEERVDHVIKEGKEAMTTARDRTRELIAEAEEKIARASDILYQAGEAIAYLEAKASPKPPEVSPPPSQSPPEKPEKNEPTS